MSKKFEFINHLIATKGDWIAKKGALRYSELAQFQKGLKITERQREAFLNTLQDILRKELDHDEFETIRRRECLKKPERFQTIAKAINRKGVRASAHQVYARALTKSRILFTTCFLAEAVEENRGCTIHPYTLQDNGFTGYAVSTDAERKNFTRKPTKETIKKYLEEYKDVLNFAKDKKENSDRYVGISKRSDIWLLEQNFIYENYAMANARAILESQDTIFEFKHNRIIDVQLPTYPEP